MFSPRSIEPKLGFHVVSKVQRWALHLSRFDYNLEHIIGSENVFADMLTRWTKGHKRKPTSSICSLVLQNHQQLVPSSREVEWPSIELIKNAQVHIMEDTCGAIRRDPEDNLLKKDGKIWIPDNSAALKLKLLVSSHCGMGGHRGVEATESIVRGKYDWPEIKNDVKSFVNGCLHCIKSRAGSRVPRPLSHTMHADSPNEILHFDYLFMGEGVGDQKYCLILKDDLSSYVWLFACTAATADNAAESILSWVASFGAMEWLVSDQGTHFKNQVIEQVTTELEARHHFTTAYTPWANGTVERVCREVLRTVKALCSEWKLSPKDWPSVIETVQSILNNAPLKRLGKSSSGNKEVYRSPIEVFTGQPAKRPLLRACPPSKYQFASSTDALGLSKKLKIDVLQESIEQMHRDVKNTHLAQNRKEGQNRNFFEIIQKLYHCLQLVELKTVV